jgi:DNA processing protein
VTAGASDRERFARIALSFVAEPGDPVLGALLRACGPAEAFAVICDGRPQQPAGASGGDGIPRLGRAIERWAARLGAVPAESRLAAWERAGIRVLCPGDPEWPTQLDVLGDARPLVLWLRGSADLRFACLRSVSVVGARAATGYGTHVAMEMAAALAERGWAVISGGPYSTKDPQARTRRGRGVNSSTWTEQITGLARSPAASLPGGRIARDGGHEHAAVIPLRSGWAVGSRP